MSTSFGDLVITKIIFYVDRPIFGFVEDQDGTEFMFHLVNDVYCCLEHEFVPDEVKRYIDTQQYTDKTYYSTNYDITMHNYIEYSKYVIYELTDETRVIISEYKEIPLDEVMPQTSNKFWTYISSCRKVNEIQNYN